VAGYQENGKLVPAYTDFAGLYARSKDQGNTGPFELPKRWEDRKTQVDMKVPFNFVSNNDIIGGNSGSPCVNAKGEVVGLIFDGNIQSLVWDIAFDQREARSVHVDSRGMIEAMRKVYDAAWLADEIQGTPKK
jgi:Peptidase S46